jgi:ubiquinone/menaquinone biosynthesis C-methylase UbiE
MSKLREHVARNRAYWDDLARQYVEAGERAWAQEDPVWGIWQVPEAELQVFPRQLSGKDAIELGCGTAYISAWLSRRGARVVGIDNSETQLRTARRLQGQYGLDFPLIHGDAEEIAYPDASFDFAISEYGDWIRLLRRSGFEVEDLIEVRAAAGAISRYPFVTLEWARQWPC